MKSLNSPCHWLVLLASLHQASGREYTRRRLGNQQSRPSHQVHQPNGDSAAEKKSSSFYDFSSLTKEEKLEMIQMAIQLRKVEDSIDWDERRSKFRETVWHDLGPKENKEETAVKEEKEVEIKDDSLNSQKQTSSSSHSNNNVSRHLQQSIDGDVFDQYEYTSGACPDAGSLGVPCPPSNLPDLCNKYKRDTSSFRACFEACGPSFCCVHDADRELNFLAPNCNTDENCPGWNWCYIAWWKMHDTIGPALFLRLEQDDEFYDIAAEDIEQDVTNDPVYNQILLHHFDDIQVIIEDGTTTNEQGEQEFNADNIFLDPEYWDTDI